MKKVILGIAFLLQFVHGMEGAEESGNTAEMGSRSFVRVDKTFPLHGSEEYFALIGSNDENTEEGTIWKFIRGLGGYNDETGRNALNQVLLAHGYLSDIAELNNLSWRDLKSLVDAESNEDRKALAVYNAFANTLREIGSYNLQNVVGHTVKNEEGSEFGNQSNVIEGDLVFSERSKKGEQDLVPFSFFQASEFRFKEKLEESVQNINNGSDLEAEVVALGNFCHNEFENARKKANGIFSKWVDEQLADQEKKMRETIESKEEEIRSLQVKLDSLLNADPNISEGIKNLDTQRRNAEENIKRIRNKVTGINIPDDRIMIGQENIINSVSGDVFEELNARKEEIQQRAKEGLENVEDILGNTQYMYRVNVKSLVRSLKLQHTMKLNYITSQYKEERQRMEEAYEKKKSLMQRMINEATALNLKLKEEKELHERISRIFIANPSLKPEKIMVRSADIIQQTDLWPRYNTAKSCYDKFVLCSELFSNKEELPRIGAYLNQLGNLLPQFEHIMKCEVENRHVDREDFFGAYGEVKEFARSRDYRQWSGRLYENILCYRNIIKGNSPIWAKGFFRQSLATSNIVSTAYPGTREDWMNPNADYYSDRIGRIIMDDFNRENNRRQKHNEELHRQALSIGFPSEEFDRFVEQFNEFVSKL